MRYLTVRAAMVSTIALLGQTTGPLAIASDTLVTAQISEIVVTAQRRSERLSEVPISITSINAEQLTSANVVDLADVQRLTPSLRFDSVGAFSQPTIRGVGTSVATAGTGSNVGIYIDGFYSPSPNVANFQLLNVDSVQVLKGPQGTLFGRNTTGGAILVTTSEPSQETEAILEASYARFNAQQYQAYATTGLSDTVAVALEGLYREGDGFITKVLTRDDEYAAYENWSVRAGVKWDLSENSSLLFRYTHDNANDPSQVATNAYRSKDGTVYSSGAAFPGTVTETRRHKISSDARTSLTNKSDIFQLTATIDFDFATLVSYTQYRTDHTDQYLDLDYSSAPVYSVKIPVEDTTFTQEFLMTSSTPGRLQWTAGLFYIEYENEFVRTDASMGGGPYVPFAETAVTMESLAGFVDSTYELTDRWFLTAGLRYSRDVLKDGFFTNLPAPAVHVDSDKDNNVSPRLVVRYKPSDHSNYYVSWTQGYKPAILNVGAGTLVDINVDREKITAYEVGYKYGSAAFSAELSAFYYDYDDLQVSSYTGSASLVTNAASSRIRGVEGQLRYDFENGLRITAGAAYLDAKYRDFTTSSIYTQCLDPVACGPAYGIFLISQGDASGNRMLRSPKFTGNLGVQYQTPLAGGELALSGNLYATSKVYFDSSNVFYQDGYELLDLRASWTDPSDRYTVALFGENVTNTKYRASVEPGSFGAASLWGQPATYGVSLRVHL